jgi:acyl-CoA thioester hydrolase
MAAVQQNISYKREMLAGDLIEIKSRLLEIRDKSVRFVHEMRNVETGETTAVCEMTAVHIDRTARKSIPWPPEVRRLATQNLEGSEPVNP